MQKIAQGFLRKMQVTQASPVQYHLRFDGERLFLNDFLGKKITLEFLNEIQCIQCGRSTKKSFQQGYCFPCMQRINECNNCMIHPERCLVETGKCPDNDWAHEQCRNPQVVYLANASGLKVGITRTTNQPARWIDQGAIQALPLFQTKNRYQCGLLEVALKPFVSDKTNWRSMLKNEVVMMDLIVEKERLLSLAEKNIDPILQKYKTDIQLLENASDWTFDYPVIEYPQKITALSLDKTAKISGVLQGIKGQYLLFDTGVLNIRKFGGYGVRFG